MTNLYRGSFIAPKGGTNFEDGRHMADAAIRKIHREGPQKPSTLAKRAKPERVALASRGQNQALNEIQKVHARGRRPGLPEHEAQGDAPFQSKTLSAIRKAHRHALRVTGHTLPSCDELSKAFASRPLNPNARDASNIHLSDVEFRKLRKGGGSVGDIPSDVWNRMSWGERSDYIRKSLSSARPRLNDLGVVHDGYADDGRGPNSSNANWNNTRADDAATTNWPRDKEPSQGMTIVGGQVVGRPSDSNRDAAVDAIKNALRSPQKLWGNSSDVDEDPTEDLDEDSEDQDEDESRVKDANAQDFGNKRKQRKDEEE
jgi:hypothetical protein